MDMKDMKDRSECCEYESCGHGMGFCGHGHWMHIIIKLFIAIFIFWAGVQFGELKGYVRAEFQQNYGYGYGMMGVYDGRFLGPNMMGGWVKTTAVSTSTPRR